MGCELSIHYHDIDLCGWVYQIMTGITSGVAVPSTYLVKLSDNLISSVHQRGAYWDSLILFFPISGQFVNDRTVSFVCSWDFLSNFDLFYLLTSLETGILKHSLSGDISLRQTHPLWTSIGDMPYMGTFGDGLWCAALMAHTTGQAGITGLYRIINSWETVWVS